MNYYYYQNTWQQLPRKHFGTNDERKLEMKKTVEITEQNKKKSNNNTRLQAFFAAKERLVANQQEAR